MPDWKQLVAERLAGSGLDPGVRREVAAEIAEHLDECCTRLVEAGCADAEEQTLAQVSDWPALCRNIRRAKEDRMGFVRKVVVPGAAAAIAATAALRLFVSLLVVPQDCGPLAAGQPVSGDLLTSTTCIIVSADGPAYLPFLATLPILGALAAWLARRLGASPSQRLVAAVAPAIYFAVDMFVMGLSAGFFWRIPVYWVLVPAVLGALGAYPFLRGGGDAGRAGVLAPSHS